jgi:hypothetical protein
MKGFPSLVNRMKRVVHFKNLSDRELLAIVRAGQFVRFAAGNVIFMEEAPCYVCVCS